jgi:chromosome segregation ATPase
MATLSGEAEDVVAATIVQAHEYQQQEISSRDEEIMGYQEQLRQAQLRIQELSKEKARYQQEAKVNAIRTERRLQRCLKQVRMEAKRQVETHVAERKHAEEQLQQSQQQIAEAQQRLLQAQQLVESSRQSQVQMETNLKQAQSKVEELSSLVKRYEGQQIEQKDGLMRMATELEKAKNVAREMEGRYDATIRNLQACENNLDEAKVSFDDLQKDMEIVCGDLVAMAQIYQVKEEVWLESKSDLEGKLKDMKRKLELERRRSDQVEDDASRLQSDNERLMKKLLKAKEKLEGERRDRRDEAERRKRNGPVSYINQLHTSMNSTFDEGTGLRERRSNSSRTRSSSRRRPQVRTMKRDQRRYDGEK